MDGCPSPRLVRRVWHVSRPPVGTSRQAALRFRVLLPRRSVRFLLPADEAAIHQEIDAGTERGCLAREKDRRANHLVDGRDPPKGWSDADWYGNTIVSSANSGKIAATRVQRRVNILVPPVSGERRQKILCSTALERHHRKAKDEIL